MKRLSAGERPSIFPSHVLHDTRHFRIEVRAGTRTILLTRLSQPFLSPEDVEISCAPVQALLDDLGRAKHNMLVDTRGAVANNDPVYESWFAAHRRRMIQGFRRTAFVIRTAVGGLQTRRLTQHDGNAVAIFTSMDEAFAYLEGDGTVPPAARPGTTRAPPATGGHRRIKE